MPEPSVGNPTQTQIGLSEDAQSPRLSPGQRQALSGSIIRRYEQWKRSRQKLESRWRECWESYLCDVGSLYAVRDDLEPDRSRICRPILFEAVEAIHTNLLNAMFPADEKFFSVLGQTEADHRQAQQIEEFLRNKLDETRFFEKYALFLKQAIITGNSVAAVPWRRETQHRRQRIPVQLMGVTVGQQTRWQEEILYNGPDFEVIDIFDFLIDPDGGNLDNAAVIRRVTRSLAYLKSTGAYENLDKLQPLATAPETDFNKQSRRTAFGIDPSPQGDDSLNNDDIELLEYWGDLVVDGTRYDNHVCVVANQTEIIRFEPNPYHYGKKPFVFTTFIPVPNEVYGIGAIEKSLGLQHAINTLTNQKLDVINLSINNPFTYLINDDVFDPDAIVTRPGALIPVKSHDTLRPIQYLNNFTVAFNEIADLKAEVQEATGALKFFTGGDPRNDTQRTATEVSALVSGGTQKFSYFIAHLQKTSLEPYLRWVFEQAKQLLSEPETIRIVNTDGSLSFETMNPGDLQGCRCQFRIDGSGGHLQKDQEMQSLLGFLRLVMQNPSVQDQVDILSLYRKIYRRLGFKDEEQLFLHKDNPPGGAA
ncbi:MAG: portal protein [Candidatus Melainabacteria bacterium]